MAQAPLLDEMKGMSKKVIKVKNIEFLVWIDPTVDNKFNDF